MAEEKDLLEELEAAEDSPKKKSALVLILVLVVVLLLLGGGGFYVYWNFIKEKPVSEGSAGEGKQAVEGEVGEEPPRALGVMYPLDPFIVNLSKSKGKRFLKVTLSLELSAPEVHAEVDENLQKITDSILVLLSSKTFEDVYSVQGKFKLKDEITTRVNRFLVLGHVKEAYFTEFIIQ